MEIVSLENASNREVAQELEQLLHIEVENPLGVVAKRRLLGIENFERLIDIGLGICRDLLARKLGTRGIAARGVSDKSRAIADDQRNAMTEVLELSELAQRDGVAEMNVRGGRIDAELDIELFASLGASREAGSPARRCRFRT